MSILNIHGITIRPPFFIHKTTIFSCYRPHLVGAHPVTGVVLDLHTPAGCRGGFRLLGRWGLSKNHGKQHSQSNWFIIIFPDGYEWHLNGHFWSFFGYFRGFQTHSMVNGVSTERFGCSFALLICAMDPEAVEPTWSGSCSSKHKETNRATRLVVLHFGPSPPRENWGFIPVYKQFHWSLGLSTGRKRHSAGSFRERLPSSSHPKLLW